MIKVIDEINKFKYVFLLKLVDDDDELHIYICGETYFQDTGHDINDNSAFVN